MGATGRMVVVRSACTTFSDYSADADTWLQWAEQTYTGSRVLFNEGNPFLWFSAALLGHQALEMFLKAALIKRGRRVAKDDVWGHDLVSLARELESSGIDFSLWLLNDLQKFNDFFEELRYPQPAANVLELGSEEGELLDALVGALKQLTT